jgi:hypothetical protein
MVTPRGWLREASIMARLPYPYQIDSFSAFGMDLLPEKSGTAKTFAAHVHGPGAS